MKDIRRDVADALRAIRSSPASSAVIVIVLALGMGANIAVFSAVDALLFRSLPVPEPGRLVRLIGTASKGEIVSSGGLSLPDFIDYRDALTSLSGLAAFRDGVEVQVSTTEGPVGVARASLVSGNFFATLGVDALAGRALANADDVAAAPPVAMLSHSYWRERLDLAPAVIGSAVNINRQIFTIVGVAPRGFAGVGLGSLPDLFIPIASAAIAEPLLQTQIGYRSNPFFQVIGRMPKGSSLAQVRAELDALSARLGAGQPARDGIEAMDPDWRRQWAVAVPAADALSPRGVNLSWLLLGTTALVLLIACTDAAGVLLARTEMRQKGIAIRMALGATRRQVMRGLLVEGLVIAGAAMLLGLVSAWMFLPVLFAIVPAGASLPLGAATNVLDPRMLGMGALVATGVGALFSLLPAFRAARVPLVSCLKNEAVSFSPARLPLRQGLVVAQVALSTVLLVGTGLLLRTLWNAAAVDPGFDSRGLFKATLNLPRGGYSNVQSEALFAPLQEALGRIPGAQRAALGTTLLLQGSSSTQVTVLGTRSVIQHARVSPGYVSTLGLSLLRGREFTPADSAGRLQVGILNETAAARLFPERDPIGAYIESFSPRTARIEVVGVVRARGGALRQADAPLLLLPLAQQWSAFPWQPSRLHLIVRTNRDEAFTAGAVSKVVASFDPQLAVMEMGSPELERAAAFAQERLLASLLSGFGLLAALLAMVGLYGLTAYTTEGRRREFGIRLALGARPVDLARGVVAQGLRITAVGLALGVLLAAGTGRAISAYVFGVGLLDPATFGGLIVTFSVISVVAALQPALRAAATDPIEALRAE